MDSEKHISNLKMFFLNIEKSFIITFILCVFVMVCLNIKLLLDNAAITPLYSFFFVNSRLVNDRYIIDMEVQPVRLPELKCKSGYSKRNFMTLENIYEAKALDITNVTRIQDDTIGGKEGVLKNLSKVTYYEYSSIQEKNVTNLKDFQLLNRYSFNNWKGSNFCVKRVFLDEWKKALQLIPSNTSCQSYFPNYSTDDCGTYGAPEYRQEFDGERYMRLCAIRDFAYADDELTTPVTKSTDQIYKNITICPLGNFDIKYVVNPDYDDNDVNSWSFHPQYMMFKENKLFYKSDGYVYEGDDINNFVDPGKNTINMLMIGMDTAYLSYYQKYPKPVDEYVFGVYDDSFIFPAKEYGLSDQMNQDIDTNNFADFYNDTFYTKKVYDAETKTYSYEPDFLTSSDQQSFIKPNVTLGKNCNITQVKRFLPIFGKKCFEGALIKNPDFLSYLADLNISFLTEFIWSNLSTCLMLILLALYNELYIRYYIINRIIANDINTYDKNSEKYTKWTHKIFEFIITFITIVFQLLNKAKVETGIHTAKDLLTYSCFVLNNPPTSQDDPDDYKEFSNEQLKYYTNYLSTVVTLFDINLITLIILFSFMVLVSLSYVYLQYSEQNNKTSDDENYIDDLGVEKKNI